MFYRFFLIACFSFLAVPVATLAAPSSTVTSTPAVLPAVETYERALVERVDLVNRQTGNAGQQVEVYRIRFLSGPLKNQTKDITSELGTNPYDIHPQVGDKIVIFIQGDTNGQANFFIEGYDRRGAVIWLVVLFVLTLVLLSGWQGAKVAASIGVSILLIGYVLIPLFLRGVNPVPIAILLIGVFVLISTGFSNGWNKRTLVTSIGTMGGALVAFLLSWLFADWMHLNGLSTDEDRLFFDKNPSLDPRGLLFAGIIIASAGVVEDVAVSIVSGVSEVKRAKPHAGFRELFSSGMVVGKDHMGALANTLVFAYVGGSLSSLLLYQQFKSSWLKFINFDTVVDEIVRSLCGTIGLVFTVPITALFAAWVMYHDKGQIPEVQGHAHLHHH